MTDNGILFCLSRKGIIRLYLNIQIVERSDNGTSDNRDSPVINSYIGSINSRSPNMFVNNYYTGILRIVDSCQHITRFGWQIIIIQRINRLLKLKPF